MEGTGFEGKTRGLEMVPGRGGGVQEKTRVPGREGQAGVRRRIR